MSNRENILDEILENDNHVEAKLMQRINALVCDALLLYVFYYALKHFVFLSYSNMVLSFTILIYKPFMELFFGGTLGKMFVKIKVSTTDYRLPSMLQVIVRNMLPITYQFISLLFISRTWSYSDKLNIGEIRISYSQLFVWGFFTLTFIDLLVLLLNSKNRSLHDIAAGTIVLQKK